MLQIHPTKRRRKRPLFRFSNLHSFFLFVMLIAGMGIGALITQQVLSPSQQDREIPHVGKTGIRVCFTPDSRCTSGIVDAIHSAGSSIFVQAYSFTSEPITNALISAKDRGVDVCVILDKSQLTAKNSQINTLLKASIPVFIDQVPGIAHNKVMIIDDAYVLTGSFNFSHAADSRNAENVLLFHDSNLAKIYKNNWNKRQKFSISCSSNLSPQPQN